MNALIEAKVSQFIKSELVDALHKGITKGYTLDNFTVNPFLLVALTSGTLGGLTPENMAKALIYPRLFGTSTSTKFGNKVQQLCVEHLGAWPSSTPGMDIEYIDKVSGREVLAQLKAGPNTINSGDVKPILSDMQSAYRLLVQNGATVFPEFAVCITYGTKKELSSHYKKIAASAVGPQTSVPIYTGKDFWHRLTGEEGFYEDLIALFIRLFEDEDCSKELEQALKSLTSEIRLKYFATGRFDPDKI